MESVLGDVTAPGSTEEAMAGCDAVLHCAAIYSFDARAAARMREVNVRGTEIVLGAGNAPRTIRPALVPRARHQGCG